MTHVASSLKPVIAVDGENSISNSILDEHDEDAREDDINEDDVLSVELAMMEDDDATDLEAHADDEDPPKIIEEEEDEPLNEPFMPICGEGSPFAQIDNKWRATFIQHDFYSKRPVTFAFPDGYGMILSCSGYCVIDLPLGHVVVYAH